MKLEPRHPERNNWGIPLIPALFNDTRETQACCEEIELDFKCGVLFCNNHGLHKGDVRSDKIARCNDVPTIGILGTDNVFAASVQICEVSASHVAPLRDHKGMTCLIITARNVEFLKQWMLNVASMNFVLFLCQKLFQF